MKVKRRLLALCMIVVVVLGGCGFTGAFYSPGFEQMEYVRPDMVLLQDVLEESCTRALEEQKIENLEAAIMRFYNVYDGFYTNMNLAFIHYAADLSDIYWETEYAYCAKHSAVAEAGLDRLYRCLAKSPLRETLESENYFGAGYFDSYEGESIYDEQMTELLMQEAQLQSQYQLLNAEAADTAYYSEEYFTRYGEQMAQVFLQLVQLRQQIAACAGYTSYVDFAYDFYHVRDYTPQQAMGYIADIRVQLAPLYRQMITDEAMPTQTACTEQDMLYHVRTAAKAMGGTIAQAYAQMTDRGLYDIAYGENKYATSFEVYLSGYAVPYVFVCPTATSYDKLTFAHEFGHFCCDFAVSGGAVQGVDVAEIFSQAMEYLSLEYADDIGTLRKVKMLDCLGVYVEQAAYASFEHQVYGLTGEELTLECISALYEQTLSDFSLDIPGRDSRDYVCVSHFYESPMYVISYVLSNDAALQIYAMEQSGAGKGLQCYVQSMTLSQPYLLAFLEEAGLQSPFADGRMAEVKTFLIRNLQ